MSQSYHRSVFPIPPQHASAISKGAEYEFHRRQEGDDLRYVASLLPSVNWFKPSGRAAPRQKVLKETVISKASVMKSKCVMVSGNAFTGDDGITWVFWPFALGSPEIASKSIKTLGDKIPHKQFRTSSHGRPKTYVQWPLNETAWGVALARYTKFRPIIWGGKVYRGLGYLFSDTSKEISAARWRLEKKPDENHRFFTRQENDEYILQACENARQSIIAKVEAELAKQGTTTDHQDATRTG